MAEIPNFSWKVINGILISRGSNGRLIEHASSQLARDVVEEATACIATLTADLDAMREDRDLWRAEHNEDCPNAAKVEALEAENATLRAQIAAYENPVTDEEWIELCAGTPVKSKIVECYMSRNGIDDFIAARAKGEQ